LRNQSTKAEDLVIAAEHCHLITLNNVSRLSNAIQDTLCTILTGGVRTARTLYSNKEQSAIQTHNPIIINGIGDIISRDDIYDRSLVLHLKKISEMGINPVSEKILTEEFTNDLPRIMGGVFNSLKAILFEYRDFEPPEKLNRMADFHILGCVTEKALEWKQGTFSKIYNANIATAHSDVIEDSKLAQALIKMKKHNLEFDGSCAELIEKLSRYGGMGNITPRKLRADIDRISQPLFNVHGIKVTHLNRKNSSGRLTITFN